MIFKLADLFKAICSEIHLQLMLFFMNCIILTVNWKYKKFFRQVPKITRRYTYNPNRQMLIKTCASLYKLAKKVGRFKDQSPFLNHLLATEFASVFRRLLKEADKYSADKERVNFFRSEAQAYLN